MRQERINAEREENMESEKFNQILEAARLTYAKSLAHGLNMLAKEARVPEEIKELIEDIEASMLKREMVSVFRKQERDCLNAEIYNELKLDTVGGRLPTSKRDEISLAGAKDLQLEARLWELGRYLAAGKECEAYFAYMHNTPLQYNPEDTKDVNFAAILAYAEKYGLEDGERWS